MLMLLVAVTPATAVPAIATAVAVVELLIRSPTVFTAVVAMVAVFPTVMLRAVILLSVFAVLRWRSLLPVLLARLSGRFRG